MNKILYKIGQILCEMDWHDWKVVAWSVMGNPIEQCQRPGCNAHAITIGCVGATRTLISIKEAEELKP